MSWDDETPKKKPAFELGADLSKYSVDELTDYLGLLDAERRRVEQLLGTKRASRDAADSVFKR
jgi:uncharacterized small protein (DUF1192 family)